jgi:hypothetical protein
VEVLTEHDRKAAHEARVDALVADHLGRRRDGVPHPVHDFLFTYYSFRPAQLRRWSPGGGTAQEIAAKLPLIRQTHALLTATTSRPANFGCFGMHEWAMVYRQTAPDTRHPWPLRLGHDGTDEVVESHRIACSHFDAFRFFTAEARPLNTLSPASHDRPAFEQPACLHAGMDLYKHEFRLAPLVPSELIADCFELARDIRVVDMRAAPYDLSGLLLDHTGEVWTPIEIETPGGKHEYVEAQKGFAARGQALRGLLVTACQRLLVPVPARPDDKSAGGEVQDQTDPDRRDLGQQELA